MSDIIDTLPDSLNTIEGIRSTDRVHYETGVLLNDADFLQEQNYNRGRLARALAYTVGTGTVAGLRVVHQPQQEGEAEGQIIEERIEVEPGLAIDPYGRMIEVPRHYCLRLDRWYQQQNPSALAQGWKAAGIAWADETGDDTEPNGGNAPAGVVVDVMIRFLNCERGKQPSFAHGPFDNLDAVTADHIRDSAAIDLHIRTEANPPIPNNGLPDFSAIEDEQMARRALHNAILDGWREGAPQTTSVFLARLVIAAATPEGGASPVRDETLSVVTNNYIRPFAVPTTTLTHWLNLNTPQPASTPTE